MEQIDAVFLTYACDILAETNTGLSGSQIVDYCNAYAATYDRDIPHTEYPLEAPNKRTALRENIESFEASEQFRIIKDLCNLPFFEDNSAVKKVKGQLFERYGKYSDSKITEGELVQSTRRWLATYPNALKQYDSALSKYEGGIFQRNTLDDMRLAFELIVKDLLGNEKSLENQIAGIGKLLENGGASVELRNMLQPVVRYYTDFQNHHIKHNDYVEENEIEFVIELTSIFMKYLIKMS